MGENYCIFFFLQTTLSPLKARIAEAKAKSDKRRQQLKDLAKLKGTERQEKLKEMAKDRKDEVKPNGGNTKFIQIQMKNKFKFGLK
jgi:hypothetical protein